MLKSNSRFVRALIAVALLCGLFPTVIMSPIATAAEIACPATNYLPNTSGYPIFDISSQFSSYMKSDGVYYKVNKVSGEAMAVGMDHSIVSNLVVPETVTVTSSMIQAAGFDSTNSNCVAFAKEYKVRYIGTDAFKTKAGPGDDFPVLSSVTINAKLKSIAKYAFGGQCKVGALVIPDAVTDIGEGAFNFMNTTTGNPNCAGSTGLQSITLGINLKRMWMSTFQDNNNLTSITFRGQVFTTTNSNNELDYPSSYDLFGFPGQFPGTRIQNTCKEIFPYVFASVSVLAGSGAGWSAWAGVNSCLNPSSSYSQTITTAPSKIATPVASNPTQSSAQVAFTAPFNGGSAITGYRVTSVPGGFTATLNGALADTVTVTGLSAATDYKFFVVAINDANEESSESELSNQITTGILTVPAISLSPISETVTVGTAVTGYVISNSGGTATSYSISPAISETPGLSFNNATGLISGTPTVIASAKSYTISASNSAGSSSTTGTFTLTVNPRTISIANLPITAPVSGATPLSSLSSNGQYTTAITWNGSPTTFAASTIYTATATLTPIAGYTLTGVTANFFTVTGATSATNSADTGVVTVVFPSTAAPVVVPTPTPTPTPSVVTGPPPSSLKTVSQPKISRNATNYICTTGSFIFLRNGYTEETPKLSSQKYFLVQDGKTVDTIETSQSQALFEKKSSYLNTTLSCMIQVGQESLVSNVSSLNSKLMTEASEIKRAELKRLDTKYYADRTAAYAKKDREFARIAEIKNLEISAAKTSSAILLASSKYRKAFTAASDLWKAELKKATTDRDAAREVAQTNYLDFLEKSGVSIYPRAAAPVVTSTPTPTPTPTPSPTATINPQPTVQMKKVGTVYMASGSYQLSAETKKQLVAVAKTINASAAKTILVYGHTDIRGGVNNTVLSQNRAKAVAAYLRPLLKVKKISIGWYASRKPLNTGNSPAALAQNRRVEVWVK